MIEQQVVIPLRNFSDPLCEQFIEWMRKSTKGNKFCYYSGPHITGQSVARLAFRAYEKGEIVIFQEREANKFKYWAKRIR